MPSTSLGLLMVKKQHTAREVMSTKFDSPALVSQSNSYPPSWHGKVPARVRMDTTVESDLPWIRGKGYCAVGGQEYDAWVNSHGAVAVIFADGEMLGIKPYEFTVIAWHESGAHKE